MGTAVQRLINKAYILLITFAFGFALGMSDQVGRLPGYLRPIRATDEVENSDEKRFPAADPNTGHGSLSQNDIVEVTFEGEKIYW
jgi:hypothetical protein